MALLQQPTAPPQAEASYEGSMDLTHDDSSSELSSLPNSPQLSPSSMTILALSGYGHQAIAAQHQSSGRDRGTITPTPCREIESQFSANGVAMLDDVANRIRSAIPWDRFTKQHGINGDRFDHEILTPLLGPLYRAASGDLDAFFNAAMAYHIAKKQFRKLVSRQEREKRYRDARELRDYEKMRDKERWHVRKTAYKKDLADMKHQLEGMKTGRKSGPYKSLEAAIKTRKDVLARAKARRQVEKKAAKEGWKITEAEFGSMSVIGGGDEL
ncbi:MAG: hypothetical protein Q9178_006816 [Gyalolechia marmorata]